MNYLWFYMAAAHSLGINMGLADAERNWQLSQAAAQSLANQGAQP